jgi:hypothetical protein
LANKSYEALWKHFVPRDGPPGSVYGEVLRAYARVGHAVNVNQLESWGPELDQSLDLIRSKMTATGDMDPATLILLEADLAAIRNAGARKALSDDVSEATGRVKRWIVDWCNRKVASLST